jgi:Protein of unknown function (DUF3551)
MTSTSQNPARRAGRNALLGLVALVLGLGAALIAGADGADAQSAYSYPWCAVYPRNIGGYACYYANYETCMKTMSGIGGYCERSPFYRGPQGPARARGRRS